MTQDYTVKRRVFDAPADPRLRRHVNHDSRSRLYPFRTEGLTLTSTKHERAIPVFDQGSVGDCTGMAGIGCLGTQPFYGDRANPTGVHYAFTENGAVALYSDATRIDPYLGVYPPTDSGSDGLSIAKALKSAGEIAGYTHTFTLDDALLALTVTPWICGTSWTDDMFEPDASGRVRPHGAVAGGHEYVAEELDVENTRIWFRNSWGPDWSIGGGRFWMTWGDFGKLLADDGDVTVFTPLSQPAPTPTPPSPPAPPAPADPDVVFAAAARDWLEAKGL